MITTRIILKVLWDLITEFVAVMGMLWGIIGASVTPFAIVLFMVSLGLFLWKIVA